MIDTQDTEDVDLAPHELAREQNLNELCEAWARWCDTRRFYVRPSLPPSVLGRLRTRGTGRSSKGGPDAPTSPQLMALHLAILAQPMEGMDRQVFELYYRWRVGNIKAAADAMGISRSHFYRMLSDFRQRVHAASLEILQINLQAAGSLPSAKAQDCSGSMPMSSATSDTKALR